MTALNKAYDCVVIGGGPAGATAATLLADHGHSVLLLERERFPRHRIGESLMPQTYFTFQRLGMLDKLRASDFPLKESVQFVSASGKESEPYFFTDRDPSEWSTTWQVPRDRFDRMMLANARDHGVTAIEGASVKRVLFEGEQAKGVEAVLDGKTQTINCRVVVDATGQNSLVARQLDLRRFDEHLKNGAIYAYYKNAYREEGRNAGATVVIHTGDRKGWFWYIPLADDITSVGLVGPPAWLKETHSGDPLARFETEIQRCDNLRCRLHNAKRVSGAYVTRDFSYHASRIAGDGWVLVGDAFGFVDPVYSSGVMLALKSGELAADVIHEGLAEDDLSASRLGAFAPKLLAGMHLIRQLVWAFYDPQFSFAKFTSAHPEYRDHLVRILIGDVFNDEVGAIFTAMANWVKLPPAYELEGSPVSP